MNNFVNQPVYLLFLQGKFLQKKEHFCKFVFNFKFYNQFLKKFENIFKI